MDPMAAASRLMMNVASEELAASQAVDIPMECTQGVDIPMELSQAVPMHAMDEDELGKHGAGQAIESFAYSQQVNNFDSDMSRAAPDFTFSQPEASMSVLTNRVSDIGNGGQSSSVSIVTDGT